MNKGLKELKRIKTQVNKTCLNDCEHNYNENCICNNNLHYSYLTIEKELKALEIIKNKRVDLYGLIDCDKLIQYNCYIKVFNEKVLKGNEREFLTQEEFDLLKEVL